MDTTAQSQWKHLNCKALAATGVPPGLGCELYQTFGPLAGAVTEYRYTIAPDRSSLVIRADTGESRDVRFFVDVNLGYHIELRGGKAVHGCGDPRRDVNPSTHKRDYLHLHLHESISLRPTSDYGLRATLSHALSPDAACTIQTLPLVHKDLTPAILAFESELLGRAEAQLEQRVIASSRGLQAGSNESWQRLQQPFTVASSFGPYEVLLHPTSVALSLLKTSGGSNDELVTGTLQLGVSVEARMGSGKSFDPVPRPPLGDAAESEQTHVLPVVATADYGFVSSALRRRLAAWRFRYRPFGSVRITDATAFPVTSASRKPARLAVESRFRGSVRGTLYAWGTPTYDVATDRLSVPDFQIAPSPHGLASRLALVFLRERRLLAKARADAVVRPDRLLATMIPARTFESEPANNVMFNARLNRVTLNNLSLTRPGITADVELHGAADIRATFDVEQLLSR